MQGIVHVGGWEGVEYLDFDGPLVIFEPQDRAFAALQQNLGGRANVMLVHAAAGARTGYAKMYQMSDDQHSSLIEPIRGAAPWIVRTGEQNVLITTVDFIMQGYDGFDLLRLDTQGYELEVLKGSVETLKRLNHVEVEIHDPTIYPAAATVEHLDEFMVEHGYRRTALNVPGKHDIADVFYERVT